MLHTGDQSTSKKCSDNCNVLNLPKSGKIMGPRDPGFYEIVNKWSKIAAVSFSLEHLNSFYSPFILLKLPIDDPNLKKKNVTYFSLFCNCFEKLLPKTKNEQQY